MKDLIKVFKEDNQILTNSRKVAEGFDKRHADVLRSIKNIEKDCTVEFNQRNFALIGYEDVKGRKQPVYNITRDGFTMLVTRFTGKKASKLIEDFIGLFNDMEKALVQLGQHSHLIKQFVLPGPKGWEKRFPDQYYKEIYRLNGWVWEGPPYYSIVGKWTRNFYARLPKGIICELENLNPADEKGVRKFKHHQLLTEDVGIPALRHLIYALTALMTASITWAQFYRLCKKAYPIDGEQFDFFIEE